MTVEIEPGPAQLREHSYAVVRGLFDAATTERLREICERVLEQWRRAPRSDNPPVSPQANYMRHLNDPEYHRDHADDLTFLLNTIGAPEVIESLSTALEEEFLFGMTSLYFNPTGESQDGFWHKDKIGEEADVSRIPETGAGLQMQIALVPTDDLELVPGSHLRDYSSEEYAICVADGEIHKRLNDMPGSTRIHLQPGDAALFTQLCIHRGRYHTDKFRRTMMISVKKLAAAQFSIRQRGLDYGCDQPWFLMPQYFDGVNEHARAFFREFVDFYSPHWRSRLNEWLKYSSLVQRLEEAGEPYPFFDE